MSTYSTVQGQGQSKDSTENVISSSYQDSTAKISIENPADSLMVKVDSVLNQAIKDAIQADIRLGVIHEKEIQLNLKDELLSQVRHKYLDCVQSNDTKDLRISFAETKIKRRNNTIKVLIFVDVGLIAGTYLYMKNHY